MNEAEKLYQLQEIEISLLRSRQRLEAIAAALTQNEAVQAATSLVETQQKALSPLQASVRNLDLEIRSTAEKASQSEDDLYSGRIKNPKQMQELEQEIASLKKRHSELETELLETMFAVEEAESTLGEAQLQLEAVTQNWQQEHGALLEEQAQLEAHIKQLQASRKQALQDIKAESLKMYETLKPRKHNQPIALMTSGTCGLCGVAQNLSVEREVRQGQKLVTCTNCGRILVAR